MLSYHETQQFPSVEGDPSPNPKVLRGDTAEGSPARPSSSALAGGGEQDGGAGGEDTSATSSRKVDFLQVGGNEGDNNDRHPMGDGGEDHQSVGRGGGEDGRGGIYVDGGSGGGDQGAGGSHAKTPTAPSKGGVTVVGNDGGGEVGGGKTDGRVAEPAASGVEQKAETVDGLVVGGGGVGGEEAGGGATGAGTGAGMKGLGGLVGPGGDLGDLGPDGVVQNERRRRLNDLVDAAVARQVNHECNVAFIKTHKTASTTLTAVMYRYGLRHGRRVARFHVEGTAVTLEHAAASTRESGNRVNIFHYHHVWDGYYRSTWNEARALFMKIMVKPTASSISRSYMSLSNNPRFIAGTKFVTVMRDPIEHWLSYFYFYFQPEMRLGVADYFKTGRHKRRPLRNPLAAEFGIYTKKDLEYFILHHLPTFSLTMLTEEVDEGLVLLGRIMDWDPIDLTYSSLLEAREGATRWDNKPLKKAPRVSELDEDTLHQLEMVTNLDTVLYEAAKKAYQKVKESHSEGFQEAVADFRSLQSEVRAVLDEGVDARGGGGGGGGEISPAREWYMPESDYYFYSANSSRWWEEYYPAPLPF